MLRACGGLFLSHGRQLPATGGMKRFSAPVAVTGYYLLAAATYLRPGCPSKRTCVPRSRLCWHALACLQLPHLGYAGCPMGYFGYYRPRHRHAQWLSVESAVEDSRMRSVPVRLKGSESTRCSVRMAMFGMPASATPMK